MSRDAFPPPPGPGKITGPSTLGQRLDRATGEVVEYHDAISVPGGPPVVSVPLELVPAYLAHYGLKKKRVIWLENAGTLLEVE